MSRDKKIKGQEGEDHATSYLVRRHYRIIGRNFRTRNGEIDIIAIDESDKGRVLAFVEVKTRQSREYGTGLEAITYWKMQALTRKAQVYKTLNPKLPDLMRIHAVTVTFSDGEPQIELVKNIG